MRPLRFCTGALVIAAATWCVTNAQAPAGGSGTAHDPVSRAQYDRWKSELSNWGRWGKEDQLGALNLVTAAKKKQAAALVRDGVSVSLAVDANETKGPDNPAPYERVMTQAGRNGSMDRFTVSVHGGAHTHLDALSHRVLDDKIYNGYPYTEVTAEEGAKKDSIYSAHDGIVTRGVLIDLPALKGVPYLDPGTRIYVEDLVAWEKKAGVTVSAGDALLIRTGRWVRRAALGPQPQNAGLDASVLPWLRQRDVAIIASELAVDVSPAGSQPLPYLAVHDFAMVFLGIHVIDNCNFTALSEAAAARQRWTFLFVTSPIPFRSGTGSPVNPLAIF